MCLCQVTPYSTDGALRAFLAASFKHGTDVRLYQVKMIQQGNQLAQLGQLGQQGRDDVAWEWYRAERKIAEADGALLLASSGTPYR